MSPVTHASSSITFPDGLVGFAGPQRFGLSPWGGEGSPFLLLQSLDDPALAFVVVPPAVFFPDYEPEIGDVDAARIGLTSAEDAVLLVIVNVPDDARDATANLLGPVIVSSATRLGVQAVLNPDHWPSRRRLVAPATAAVA